MHLLFDARLLHRPLSGLERLQKNVLRELAGVPAITRIRAVVMQGTALPADVPARVEIVPVRSAEDILAILLSEDPRQVPDLYHLTWFPDRAPKELFLPLAAKASVVGVADAILNRHPEYHPNEACWAGYHRFVRMLVRSCDRLIAISRSAAGEAERDLGADPARVDVALLGVDPDLDAVLPPENVTARLRRLGIEEPYVLALGKDYPHKDHATALRALARVPELHLVCAGTRVWGRGETSDQLAARLSITKRVKWISDLPDRDVRALMQGARALVFPSREEGFGLPPLEAMAVGTPALVTQTSSMPEVCGDGAWYFPPGDDARLSALLRQLLAGGPEVQALVARGRERVRRFSWRKCALDTYACYERAIASAAAKPPTRPVLDPAMRDVLRTIATSPFHDGAAWHELDTRHTALERHTKAVEANREEILRQLAEARRSAGQARR